MGNTGSKKLADWGHLQGLFPAYLAGDAVVTRELFTELLRVIQGYLRVRISSQADAEDLAQAALLKIHFARDRFDPKQSLKTWIFTVASRTLIDHWRGTEAEFEDLSVSEEQASDLLDPERKVELHGDLNQALMKLKPIERSIVYLYGVEGLSMAEIGQALSITESAAKLRAHRAYKELREVLGLLIFFMIGLYCLKGLKWM